jgi:two-component system chemotaxis sensor kinase CheA
VPADPYRYFRVEARELLDGLGRGVIKLERGATPELAAELLRFAHTLKGAARVVKQRLIAEEAHAIEEALAPLRVRDAVVPVDSVDEVLRLLDRIAAQLGALDEPAAAPEWQDGGAASLARAADEPLRSIRADVAEMDALLNGVAEANVAVKALRRTIDVVERARHLARLLAERPAAGRAVSPSERSIADELRDSLSTLERRLANGVDHAEREMKQVRDVAERLRLVPASTLFAFLERATRDAAHTLGKPVTFDATGGDVRLDAPVLAAAQGALVQMVRNAVAHGIESAAERASAGKPPAGLVAIRIFRRGGGVVFVCRDDGRGIDLEAVRRVAQDKGLLPPGGAGDPDGQDGRGPDAGRLLALLLKGGLTTAPAVTELSGRGIGLDVVRETADRLGGEVTARTKAGNGTELELVVPVSLSSVDALLVEAGGISAAIPLSAVRRTLRLAAGDVARTAGGESINYEGQVIPFVPLARSLRGKASAAGRAMTWSAVVVDGTSALAAVGVDRLLGISCVVVRGLPRLAPADPLVAGATFDAEGLPQLVLDPVAMVAGIAGLTAAGGAPGSGGAPDAKPAAAVLVIDDSLTTRMLEQSILESAGYDVDLASSAEEGLEKAARRRYQLFLVDVEMPGMDGFAFVEKTRGDPAFRDVPAILVSSRDAPEDRRRGEEAGAHAYIIKGDFDQVRILDIIRKLVG